MKGVQHCMMVAEARAMSVVTQLGTVPRISSRVPLSPDWVHRDLVIVCACLCMHLRVCVCVLTWMFIFCLFIPYILVSLFFSHPVIIKSPLLSSCLSSLSFSRPSISFYASHEESVRLHVVTVPKALETRVPNKELQLKPFNVLALSGDGLALCPCTREAWKRWCKGLRGWSMDFKG